MNCDGAFPGLPWRNMSAALSGEPARLVACPPESAPPPPPRPLGPYISAPAYMSTRLGNNASTSDGNDDHSASDCKSPSALSPSPVGPSGCVENRAAAFLKSPKRLMVSSLNAPANSAPYAARSDEPFKALSSVGDPCCAPSPTSKPSGSPVAKNPFKLVSFGSSPLVPCVPSPPTRSDGKTPVSSSRRRCDNLDRFPLVFWAPPGATVSRSVFISVFVFCVSVRGERGNRTSVSQSLVFERGRSSARARALVERRRPSRAAEIQKASRRSTPRPRHAFVIRGEKQHTSTVEDERLRARARADAAKRSGGSVATGRYRRRGGGARGGVASRVTGRSPDRRFFLRGK